MMTMMMVMMITQCDGEVRKAANNLKKFKNIRIEQFPFLTGVNGILW